MCKSVIQMLEKELLERLQSRPIHVENAERRGDYPTSVMSFSILPDFLCQHFYSDCFLKKHIFQAGFMGNNDEKMICGTRFFSARDPSNSTLNHSLISPHKKGGEDLGEASNRENPSFRKPK